MIDWLIDWLIECLFKIILDYSMSTQEIRRKFSKYMYKDNVIVGPYVQSTVQI